MRKLKKVRLGAAVLMVCLLLAGCNSIRGPSAVSLLWTDRPPASATPRKPQRAKRHGQKRPWFGFWYQAEEPRPPESLDEWMDLEPIRP